MKTAKIMITVVELRCPYCKDSLINPHELSFLFYLEETYPDTIFCDICQHKVKTPTKLNKGDVNQDVI